MPAFIGYAIALLLLIPNVVYPAAIEEQILLSSIDVSSDVDQESIILKFQSDYNAIPSINFEQGLVWIELPHTDYAPSLSFLSVNDRFIQALRLGKEGKSSILEVQFADPKFQAIGLINYQAEDDILYLSINRKKNTTNDEPEENTLSQAIKQAEKAQAVNFLPGEYVAESSVTANIIKMLLALFAILLFFYFILWIYNRFFVSRFNLKKGDFNIRVMASYHLSPKQKIVIIEVNGATFICGVTPHNISILSKVADNAFVNFLSNYKSSSGKSVDFFELRAQYLENKRQQQSSQNSPKANESETDFASELVNRVKKLRPID